VRAWVESGEERTAVEEVVKVGENGLDMWNGVPCPKRDCDFFHSRTLVQMMRRVTIL
jgi:hypothetical protein